MGFNVYNDQYKLKGTLSLGFLYCQTVHRCCREAGEIKCCAASTDPCWLSGSLSGLWPGEILSTVISDPKNPPHQPAPDLITVPGGATLPDQWKWPETQTEGELSVLLKRPYDAFWGFPLAYVCHISVVDVEGLLIGKVHGNPLLLTPTQNIQTELNYKFSSIIQMSCIWKLTCDSKALKTCIGPEV